MAKSDRKPTALQQTSSATLELETDLLSSCILGTVPAGLTRARKPNTRDWTEDIRVKDEAAKPPGSPLQFPRFSARAWIFTAKGRPGLGGPPSLPCEVDHKAGTHEKANRTRELGFQRFRTLKRDYYVITTCHLAETGPDDEHPIREPPSCHPISRGPPNLPCSSCFLNRAQKIHALRSTQTFCCCSVHKDTMTRIRGPTSLWLSIPQDGCALVQ